MQFDAHFPKQGVFDAVHSFLEEYQYSIQSIDNQRPWGGFFLLHETQVEQFITQFFPHLSLEDFKGYSKLSPKILIVAPGKRLSWQYHHRRAEIWKVIGGEAAIVVSETDEETPMKALPLGTVIHLEKGQRHRLIGTKEWGIVAEIWKHTDPTQPSDEQDIVRVQDDFGR